MQLDDESLANREKPTEEPIKIDKTEDSCKLRLCSTACNSREAQSRYLEVVNFQRNSSIHRTITKRRTAGKL